MSRHFVRWLTVAMWVMPVALFLVFMGRSPEASVIPNPKIDAALAPQPTTQVIVLAGGCFWGVEAVFEHTKGVTRAVSGYAGGTARDARYDIVSSGTTNHAESVEVTFDPSKITLGQILKIYFSVAHDPTELNRQGPDEGTQYRSSIFFTTPEQEKVAKAYIAQLDAAKAYPTAIVTEVVPLQKFYPAEAYHQNYASLHPTQPYIAVNDLPKVANLKKQFPELYVERDVAQGS